MKSKEIKAYNLPSERRIIYRMETKPYILLGALLCLGIITFKFNSMLAIVISATMTYAIVILPTRILLDFTEFYLVMYNRGSKNDCIMIYYDEIVSWRYRKGTLEDELSIELIDGSIERIECFNRYKVRKLLGELAPSKERRRK